MSNHVVGIDALEARRMMFAQPIDSDASTIKRHVAVTDGGVYFETQPTSIGINEPSEERAYFRYDRATRKATRVEPARGDSWDLSKLSRVRRLGDHVVLMSFADGLWSVRDDSKTAERIGKVAGADLDAGVVIGGTFYFRGVGGGGDELFATDGTAKNTRALPELRKGTADGNPKALTAAGSDLLLLGKTDDKSDPTQLLRWDGRAFRKVTSGKGIASVACADGRAVIVRDGKLFTLSSDYKTATGFAGSRATEVTDLTAIGKSVAFFSSGGVFRSDLTTRGTIRIGDVPIESHQNYTTEVRIASAGYLIHAYGGTYVSGTTATIGGGTSEPSATPPAIYRLDAEQLTKVLDGSFGEPWRIGNATYLIGSDGTNAGGPIVRVADDGTTTTLSVDAASARADGDGSAIAFAGDTSLYLVDPKISIGAVEGVLFSDENLNRKYNRGDRVISGDTVFADYDRDGVQDAGEPSAPVVLGGFTLTGLRAGEISLIATVGSNYRGGIAAGLVRVTAGGVTNARLLATPIFSTVRVQVFKDANGDGKRDKNERPAAGYTAFIDANGNKKRDDGERVAVVGAGGVATFAQLRPGLFRVRVQRLNADDVFTTATNFSLRTSGEQTAVGVVGVVGAADDPKTGSIRGQLSTPYFTTGLGDVKIGLYRDDVYVKQTVASDTGRFNFKYLTRGYYDVRVIASGRYEASGSEPLDVEPDEQVKTTVTFAVSQTISGTAFFDKNGNGRRDKGEPTVAGVPVWAIGSEWVVATTDAQGRYQLFMPFGYGLTTQSAVSIWSRSDDDTTSYSDSFVAIPDGSAFVAQTTFDLPLFRLP